MAHSLVASFVIFFFTNRTYSIISIIRSFEITEQEERLERETAAELFQTCLTQKRTCLKKFDFQSTVLVL